MKYLLPIFLMLAVLFSACQASPAYDPTVSTQPTETLFPTEVPTEPESTVPPTTQPLSLIDQMISTMTLEEKVGQLFLARCPDVGALEDLKQYQFGGYILFGRDFQNRTPAEAAAYIEDFQNASSIPLLIAVDEEGGTVTRVSRYSQYRDAKFPSPRWLYNQGGLELVLQTEEEKCILLNSLGINVNMAPVCDVTTDPNAFMYSRSLGQSPETTAQYIQSTVSLMSRHNIGSVLKHFPGYGNNADTHTGIAADNRTLEELLSADLVPFSAGIEAGCGAILVSHTFVNCLDTAYPASLSPLVISYLRQDMGFSGVVVTDDLAMGAITELYGAGEAAVLAVLAGNDLLISSEYQIQYDAVLEAVRSGRISEEMLNESVKRILTWKENLGLINND